MFRLKPIQPQDALPVISNMYQDIQRVFAIDTIPLLFQYLANYELYLAFIWEKIKMNVQSDTFQMLCHDIKTFSLKAIAEVDMSRDIPQFIATLHPVEQQQFIQTILRLEDINAKFMLLTIDLRESMKSIAISTERLTQQTAYEQTPVQTFTRTEMSTQTVQQEMTRANALLAPLFGENTIVVSHYPEFFAYVADSMEKLKRTESYLKKRVELEHLGLLSITKLPQPLGCSYKEFKRLTEEKPNLDELLYILTDAFPSQFPHLVLATAFMEHILRKEKAVIIQ